MTENVNYEELPEDVDDDALDDSVSPDLGNISEQEIPDFNPEDDNDADN